MAGTESFIQVALDSTGKLVRNIMNTIGANNVYQQVVSRAKSDGTLMDDEATQTTLAAVLAELLLKARLADTQPVIVANPTANPETGLAKDATLALLAKLTDTQPVYDAAAHADAVTLDADLQAIAQNTRAQPWYMVPLPTTPWFTGG